MILKLVFALAGVAAIAWGLRAIVDHSSWFRLLLALAFVATAFQWLDGRLNASMGALIVGLAVLCKVLLAGAYQNAPLITWSGMEYWPYWSALVFFIAAGLCLLFHPVTTIFCALVGVTFLSMALTDAVGLHILAEVLVIVALVLVFADPEGEHASKFLGDWVLGGIARDSRVADYGGSGPHTSTNARDAQ